MSLTVRRIPRGNTVSRRRLPPNFVSDGGPRDDREALFVRPPRVAARRLWPGEKDRNPFTATGLRYSDAALGNPFWVQWIRGLVTQGNRQAALTKSDESTPSAPDDRNSVGKLTVRPSLRD